MIAEEDVRRIALALPGAFEAPSYGGRPSWRTKQRMFTWLREEPEALVVWVESLEDKAAMLETDSDRFFTIDHYDGHPIVLVRLETVDVNEAEELIIESWRQRAGARAVAAFDADRS